MKHSIKSCWKSYMLRPTLYKTFSRVLVSLTAALLWDRFVNRAGLYSLWSHAFPIIGICWGLAAWFSYLSLDGIHFPKILPDRPRTPVRFSHRDMSDDVDQAVVSFDDLEEDEKSVCRMISSLSCCLLFLLLSLF